jgi:hypothetical protein
MKKTYMKPAVQVVTIHQQQHMLEGSSLPVGGGTTENQFAREFGGWDEEE